MSTIILGFVWVFISRMPIPMVEIILIMDILEGAV